MNANLIKEYIDRLTTKDIETFSVLQGVSLNKEEIEIIFEYIKNHWRTFYYGNPRPLLDELKQKINQEAYYKIEALYAQAKSRLSDT